MSVSELYHARIRMGISRRLIMCEAHDIMRINLYEWRNFYEKSRLLLFQLCTDHHCNWCTVSGYGAHARYGSTVFVYHSAIHPRLICSYRHAYGADAQYGFQYLHYGNLCNYLHCNIRLMVLSRMRGRFSAENPPAPSTH